MQILLPSLSLNNSLLSSYIPSAPIVHCHTSQYTKNITYHAIIASHYFKNHHFLFAANQLLPHMLRISRVPHQNYHFLLARTNHYYFLALYFCTTLPHWVSLFLNFYYEYHHILFIDLSETNLHLNRFLYHIQASCARTRRTDFNQNMAVIYSSELTPYFISPPHIHFLHISIIAMWKFCTVTVRISFFITHIVDCLSVLLPSCNNFTCCLISLHANVHIDTILILYLPPNNLFLYHSSLAW